VFLPLKVFSKAPNRVTDLRCAQHQRQLRYFDCTYVIDRRRNGAPHVTRGAKRKERVNEIEPENIFKHPSRTLSMKSILIVFLWPTVCSRVIIRLNLKKTWAFLIFKRKI